MTHEQESPESEIYIPPSQPFYFDPKRKLFIIGFDQNRKEFNPNNMVEIAYIDRETYEANERIDSNISETMVKAAYGPVILMGSGRKILLEINKTQEQKDKFSKKIRSVIGDVYRTSNPSIKIPSNTRLQDIFDCRLMDDGTFILNTLGSCSCFGPDGTSYVGRPIGKSWTDDITYPVSLIDHNAESRAQKLSLYAGAGAIGWITKQIANGLD